MTRLARYLTIAIVALLALPPCTGAALAARWRIQPTPTSGIAGGELSSVSCTSSFTCFAVGNFSPPRAQASHPLAERWDGVAWEIQPTPLSTEAGALLSVACTSRYTCVAVGSRDTRGGSTIPIAMRWNGVTWSTWTVPRPVVDRSPDDATLYGVSCPSATDCIAVGSDDVADEPLAERWNGKRWSIQRTPKPNLDGSGLSAISCPASNDCTAVGGFRRGDTGCTAPLVEHWDGARWRIQRAARLPECGAPNDSGFDGVSCPSRVRCTAVGSFSKSDGAYDLTLAEGHRPGSWTIQPTPGVRYLVDPWGGGGALNDVNCTSLSTCVAVGYAGSEVGVVPIIERWDGRRWMLAASGRPPLDGALLGLSCTSSTRCTAVGVSYAGTSDANMPLVERLS